MISRLQAAVRGPLSNDGESEVVEFVLRKWNGETPLEGGKWATVEGLDGNQVDLRRILGLDIVESGDFVVMLRVRDVVDGEHFVFGTKRNGLEVGSALSGDILGYLLYELSDGEDEALWIGRETKVEEKLRKLDELRRETVALHVGLATGMKDEEEVEAELERIVSDRNLLLQGRELNELMGEKDDEVVGRGDTLAVQVREFANVRRALEQIGKSKHWESISLKSFAGGLDYYPRLAVVLEEGREDGLRFELSKKVADHLDTISSSKQGYHSLSYLRFAPSTLHDIVSHLAAKLEAKQTKTEKEEDFLEVVEKEEEEDFLEVVEKEEEEEGEEEDFLEVVEKEEEEEDFVGVAEEDTAEKMVEIPIHTIPHPKKIPHPKIIPHPKKIPDPKNIPTPPKETGCDWREQRRALAKTRKEAAARAARRVRLEREKEQRKEEEAKRRAALAKEMREEERKLVRRRRARRQKKTRKDDDLDMFLRDHNTNIIRKSEKPKVVVEEPGDDFEVVAEEDEDVSLLVFRELEQRANLRVNSKTSPPKQRSELDELLAEEQGDGEHETFFSPTREHIDQTLLQLSRALGDGEKVEKKPLPPLNSIF